jgi:hypothetical protein
MAVNLALTPLARALSITFLLAVPLLAPASAASLFGSRISGSYNYPCVGCDPNVLPPSQTGGTNYIYSTNPIVVGPGIETILNVNPSHGDFTTVVDFDADSLLLTMTAAVSYTGSPFNGPVFTVLSGHSFGSITGVEVDRHCTPCSPLAAFLSGNSLFINWQDGGGTVGDTIRINFSVGDPVFPSAVPLPAAFPLFAAGLGGLGLLGWRRKRVPPGASFYL